MKKQGRVEKNLEEVFKRKKASDNWKESDFLRNSYESLRTNISRISRVKFQSTQCGDRSVEHAIKITLNISQRSGASTTPDKFALVRGRTIQRCPASKRGVYPRIWMAETDSGGSETVELARRRAVGSKRDC